MMDTYRELLDELSQTTGRIQDLLAEGSEQQTPADGWGPAQILAHLADVERVYRERMQAMLTQEVPYLRPFDADAAAAQHNYAGRVAREALEEFATERAQTLELLINLALKDWDRPGMHDEMGEVSIEDLAERLTEHDAEHLTQLRDALARA